MIFRRREKPAFSERVRSWIWPRRGFKRALLYRMKRLARVAGSPHTIAAGAAAGAFAAFSPFFGFHYIIAATLAFILNGSIIASALLTTAANPLTLPLFWTAAFWVGHLLLGGSSHFEAAALLSSGHSTKALVAVLKPMVAGSVVLGAVVGVVVYILVRQAVTAYRHKRRHRLAARRRRIMAEPAVRPPSLEIGE